MNNYYIVPIVEGYAETESVPILIRRMLSLWGYYHINVAKPVRIHRNRVSREGGIERSVELALLRPNCDAVMVLLDADDDCPKELAPALTERARTVSQSLPVSVVFAKSEFESWFVGSINSLSGIRGIVNQLNPPINPEDIRDAKGYLSHNMQSGSYSETDDQPAFADKFSIDVCLNNCRSFRKFIDDLRVVTSTFTVDT